MAEFKTKNTFKTLLIEEMINFLSENGTDEERKEFAQNCYTKYERDSKGNKKYNADGSPKTLESDKLNLMYAKEKFCEKYAPDLVPKAKEKEKKPLKSEKINAWL